MSRGSGVTTRNKHKGHGKLTAESKDKEKGDERQLKRRQQIA